MQLPHQIAGSVPDANTLGKAARGDHIVVDIDGEKLRFETAAAKSAVG